VFTTKQDGGGSSTASSMNVVSWCLIVSFHEEVGEVKKIYYEKWAKNRFFSHGNAGIPELAGLTGGYGILTQRSGLQR
jgi:hypothetical protein